MEIYHFSHPQHPLILKEVNDTACMICYRDINGPSYACELCMLYIHKSCSQLSPTIEHPFHGRHVLSLQQSREFFSCDACELNIEGFSYRCNKCDFDLHTECASLKPNIKYVGHKHLLTTREREIYHFSHLKHPLILKEVKDTACMICYRDINGPSYACELCMLYIHESCCQLSATIQHPFHGRHVLSLQQPTMSIICDACDLSIEGFSYSCRKCDFDLHSECTSLKPNIKYEGHKHLLTLIENTSYKSECSACGFEIHGVFFVRCVECDIDFHVECEGPGRLPATVVDQRHLHPLDLIPKIEEHTESVHDSLYCDTCHDKINATHPAYYCAECDFRSHVRCIITEVKLSERKRLVHFSHPHPLFLLGNKSNDDDNFCYACGKSIRELAFGCDVCGFYLHKSCFELPVKIGHPFHEHPLTLNQTSAEVRDQCNACRKYFNGFTYCCRHCDFNLDLDCASLWPSIKFIGHKHFLTLFENLYGISNCIVCGPDSSVASYFRCVTCDLNVHLRCCGLPKLIDHWSHHHPLILMNAILPGRDCGNHYVCDVCEEERTLQIYYYCCEDCHFVAEISCAISEEIFTLPEEILAEGSNEATNVQDEDIERRKHFSHPHSLFLQKNEDNDSFSCGFCLKGIQGPLYCCDVCKYYLHQSCAKLRKTIVHPFHRHRLTLRKPYVDEHRPCIACYKVCEGFFFSCDICNFDLHVDCEKLQPSIVAEDRHEHNLTLFEKLHEPPECIGCKVTPTTASYLRCVRCNFNVHVRCSRLPRTIMHDSHHHELTLLEKFVDEEYEYEICDVCEEKRNREECVYYCGECYFVAEFNCVISEVITYLKKRGTRNLGYIIIKGEKTYRAIERRLQDILDCLTEEDQTKINGLWEDIGRETKNIKRTLTTGASDGEVNYSEVPPYLAKLIRNLGSQELKKGLSKKFWHPYDEVGTVGDYTISRNLAPVLEKLIAKYGDFGANCSFSECLMTYLLLRLCEVVQSMRETKVVDITDELMFDWWHQLKFVGHGGLQIDFAFDHLNRIAQARDVIDTEDYENSPLHGLQKETAKYTDEIEDLMAKVKKLEQQKLKVISEHSESSGRDPKRLSEGLDLILRNAGAGLLGHFDITVDGETDSVRLFKLKLELR